jgi:WhiB family redox-sensing transcriptional regulator
MEQSRLVMTFLDNLLEGLEWKAAGACHDADTDLFFDDDDASRKAAHKLCCRCTIQTECLLYAITEPHIQHWGIWGGLSPRERSKIIKRRRELEGLDTYGRPKIEVTV